MLDQLIKKGTADLLRKIADSLDGQGSGKGKGEDGTPTPDYEGEWLKDFDRDAYDKGGSGGSVTNWEYLMERYRDNPFLKPKPPIYKKRYTYDREFGERSVMRDAEEYSDITEAAATDFMLDEYDERLSRKEFDIKFYQTELKSEMRGKPYSFFLCDISGSMNGIRAKHACALAQAAAELAFKDKGVFVWMPYGTERRDAIEFTEIEPLIAHLRKEEFNCGTTQIGENLKALAQAIMFRTPYKHQRGEYIVPTDCNEKRSKVFVIHDGEDKVDDVTIRTPIFSIAVPNHHEMLEKVAKKSGGKYLHIDKP